MRLLAVITCLLTAATAQGDTVSLRPTVRLNADGPITLEQISTLEGPAAESLAGIVIAETIEELSPGRDGWRTIRLHEVRDRLESHDQINWGRLSLRGSVCAIRVPRTKATPEPTAKATKAKPAVSVSKAVTPAPRGPVRDQIESTIRSILGVEAHELRITYDERDHALLTEPTVNRVVDVKPAGRGDRMPMVVTIYEGDQIVLQRTIRIDAEVLRTAVVLRNPINRGETIPREAVTVRTTWIRADLRPASEDAVIGSAARGRMDAGAVVEFGDIEAPIAARRGERITVHCVTGTVVLRTQGRVMSEARDGELVEIKMIGSNRRVTARMSGPGTAVIVPPEAVSLTPTKPRQAGKE